MTTRRHFTRVGPLFTLRAVPMLPQKHRSKPNGFWYEVDGDWERWCESEQPDWIDGALVYDVDISQSRILHIKTEDELLAFDASYRSTSLDPVERRSAFAGPEFHKLEHEWDGMEIAPYLWTMRLMSEVNWYYTWDCASGVVWRASKLRVTPAKITVDG